MEAKLNVSPLSDHFEDVPPEKGKDPNFAVEYFRDLFQEKLKTSNVEEIFFHTTCAIDTKSFQKVYTSIRESVIGTQFNSVGL